MKYEEFLGKVQHRCRLGTRGEAVTPGQWRNLFAELPNDYSPLLESGSEGSMKTQ